MWRPTPRRLAIEHLEGRDLLHSAGIETASPLSLDRPSFEPSSALIATDWTNAVRPADVNDDQVVAPNDALVLVIQINRGGARELSLVKPMGEPWLDVNGDGWLSPADVLQVVNFINANPYFCFETGVECIGEGDEAAFQDVVSGPGPAKTFYILPSANLERLDIRDRAGDTLHFLEGASISGLVQSPGHWTTNRGVVNVIDSQDLRITGLDVTNRFQYQPTTSHVDLQSSTAINVGWSRNIQVDNAHFVGHGKNTVWVQGNADVQFNSTNVECYYFCVSVFASDMVTQDLNVIQNNRAVSADKHATFWVSANMRATDTGEFFAGSLVDFRDTTVRKATGEGIVVGDADIGYRSNVWFRGQTQVMRSGYAASAVDAWSPLHPNYNGITTNLSDYYPLTTTVASSPGQFGRFLFHQFGSSGLPPASSPLVVCTEEQCVSSNEI